MPINHAIWKIGQPPQRLQEASLGKEDLLERMILVDSEILSDRWMLIGRQVRTSHGGLIDLMALNQDGQVIVIELKRDQTPRQVVAQALDYASWARGLSPEKIAEIYDRFSNGASLDAAFYTRFGIALDEEQLNGSHQVVIVATSLDPSTERIVDYLNGMDVPINVIFFQVFEEGDNQYLSRAWFIDPIETEGKAPPTKGQWNGEYYVSFGHNESRDWDEAIRYGFISAGGGTWFTKTVNLLSPGDRIWVNVPGTGYVGVGRVIDEPVLAKEFHVEVDGQMRRFLEIAKASYNREFLEDEEKSEMFVPVEWINAVPLSKAVSEVGFFGNQNTVCRPRTSKWDHTIDRLKRHFSITE